MNKCFFILFLLILIILINKFCSHENFSNIDSKKSYILPKVIYCYWDNKENELMNCFINNWKKKLSKDLTVLYNTKL